MDKQDILIMVAATIQQAMAAIIPVAPLAQVIVADTIKIVTRITLMEDTRDIERRLNKYTPEYLVHPIKSGTNKSSGFFNKRSSKTQMQQKAT